MKKVRQWCGFGAALLLVTGCYIEPTKDEEQDTIQKAKKAASDRSLGLDQDAGTCRFGLGKGCFDGHVAAKTAFYIEGKQFFNADDLATRFKELINVQLDGKKLNEGKDGYELKLLTALDNNSFLQGFTYELFNGPMPRTGNLRSDGNFSVDDLVEGNYDLRVGKSVKFTLTSAAATPVVQPAGTLPPSPPRPAPGPAPATTAPLLLADPASTAPVTKVYCATIYSDTSINVRAGKRLWNTLSDYRLHVTDNQCMNGGNQAVLTL